MTSLNIPSGKEAEDLPYLYWISKLHKTPYKERYIASWSLKPDMIINIKHIIQNRSKLIMGNPQIWLA
jgi:hypothetical protein